MVVDDLELYALCHKIAGVTFAKYRVSRDDAEDFASIAYMKCRGKDMGNPKAYILEALRNVWKDSFKSINGAGWSGRVQMVEAMEPGYEIGDSSNEKLDLWDAIQEVEDFNPLYAEVLILDMVGHSAIDASAIVGDTIPAYKSRLYRARVKMHEITNKKNK